MPRYQITAPDGQTYEIHGPEGATREQIIERVQRQLSEKQAGEKTLATMQQNATDAVTVPVIAAGRTGDKVMAGVKDAALGANVAAREAMGMPNLDQLKQMAALEEIQKGNDAAYEPLKQQHPFLTGLGETLPMMAVPGGQATALGRIAAPVVAGMGTGALSYGSPEERAKMAMRNGALNLLGGGAGEVVRGVVAPAKSGLSAAQQAAVSQAAQKIGYTPRASDLTGSETLRRVEDTVSRMPGGAGPMRELMDQNDRAVARHAGKAIGEKTDALTQDVMGDASERISGTYEQMKGRATMPVSQPIFDAMKRAEGFLTKGDQTGPKKEALDTIQRLKDELYQTKQFSGADYQSWTTDLGAKARELGKTNRTAAAALREVEKAMDSEARGADAALWAKTDKQNASLEMLMKPGVVNDASGKVSQLKLANKMEQQFGKQLKTGKMSGELVDLYNLARAMPPMAEGSQTAGREAFASIPAWLTSIPTYALSKALTSQAGRDYLSKGLLGHPGVSQGAAGLLGRASFPLTIAEIERQMLGYQ
jgi:hypothetical protein